MRYPGLVTLTIFRATEVTKVTIYVREKIRERGRLTKITATKKTKVTTNKYAINTTIVKTK